MTATTHQRLFLTAPAGNIGTRVSTRITQAGASVSALILEADVAALDPSFRDHAELHIGTLANAGDVIEASRGCSAMLLILPPVFADDDAIGVWETYAVGALSAIKQNQIERVVFVSTQGAGAIGAKVMDFSFELESRLQAATPNVRALRPGPLMENFLNEAEPLKHGLLPLVAGPNTTMALVAAQDVGDVAADLLLDGSWTDFEVVTPRGPDVLKPEEAANIISAVLGRAVAYQEVTAAELTEEIVNFGLARGAAETIAEVFEKSRDWDASNDVGVRLCPTTLEAFTREKLLPALG